MGLSGLNGPERVDTARDRRRGYADALRFAELPELAQYAIWAPMMSPPLTVVEQPAERLGETAAQLLLSTLRDGGPRRGQRVVLESRLVLRHSHWGPRERPAPS